MKHAPRAQRSLHTCTKPIKPVGPEMDNALDARRAFVGACEQHKGKPIMTHRQRDREIGVTGEAEDTFARPVESEDRLGQRRWDRRESVNLQLLEREVL